MSTSSYRVHSVDTHLVPSPVAFATLSPGTDTEGLPLLLLLHGGGGSHELLEDLRPLVEQAWATGELPPSLVATPSANRSFYLDDVSGSQRWETFVLDELIPHLRRSFGSTGPVALCGVSMGGMGALRMAFRRPQDFVAVAALEPAIEPSTEWDKVLIRDRVYREDELLSLLYGDPVDPDHFRDNHPIHLATDRATQIAASGLAIYLECGDEDLLHLHHGAEALHRLMFDIGLPHEYRLVRGADHLGGSLARRFPDAFAFLGRAYDDTPEPEDEQLAGFRAVIDVMELSSGYRRIETVDGPAGPIEVTVVGEGPAVVLLPSLGRGAGDFADLAARLANHGHMAVCPQPRGIGTSAAELDGLTMFDLAADVAAVIRALGVAPATVVGHAFGNRVARMTATEYPELIDGVVLLACGGLVPPAPEHAAALEGVFDSDQTADEHLDAVRTAFFAPGNDPAVWSDGWHGAVADAQLQATRSLPAEHWWRAGRADVLVVQPENDVIAVPANAQAIADDLGPRASVVTVPRAGHALLPEQPEAVATAILTWFQRLKH